MASNIRSLTVSTGAMPSTARVPQVYQIDFTAVASGKRVASTKRRVRWRFGFANPEALSAGETGTACRGEEHDVTLVWSITSGKRLILADGQEVHYSNSRSGVFDHTWTMRGNHVLKVVAHASPPLSPTPGFRQYDFFVDGQTFFSFPKVYRLGLAPNDPRNSISPSSPVRLADRGDSFSGSRRKRSTSGIASIEAPHNPDEEEAYLQEAIKNSLKETQRQSDKGEQPSISAAGQSLLLDFLAEEQAPLPAHVPSNAGFPALVAPDGYGFAAPPGASAAVPALPPSANGYTAAHSSPGIDAFGAPGAYGVPGAMVLYAVPGGAPQQQAYPGAPPVQHYGQPQLHNYGQPPLVVQTAPTSSTPMAHASPSTLGFGSPQPDFAGFATPAPAVDFAGQHGVSPIDGYGAPTSNPFGGSQSAGQYGALDQFRSSQAAGQYGDQFGASQTGHPFGGGNQFLAATDQFGKPTPGSPAFGDPDFGQAPAPSAGSSANLTMDSLQGTDPGLFGNTTNGSKGGTDAILASSSSLADQAYAKFARMDQFDLVSKKDAARDNPFEAAPIGGEKSLADMKKLAKSAVSKPIMNSRQPMQPGALIVSGTQAANWGSSFGGAPPVHLQPPVQQPLQHYGHHPQYGPPQHQQQLGQQPQYGQPQQPFGLQSQYGQQPQYGQQTP